jgi:hypothetical protein
LSSASTTAASIHRLTISWVVFFSFFLVGFADGFYKPAVSSSTFLYWSVDLIGKVLVPTLGLYVYQALEIRPGEYGLRAKQANLTVIDFIGLSVLCAALLALVNVLVSSFLGLFFARSTVVGSYHSMLPTGVGKAFGAVYLAASASFFEEVFFVGILGYNLSRTVARRWFPLLFPISVAVLAALIHWEGGMRNLIAAGATFGVASLLYLKIRTLWPLIVGHFLIDLVLFLQA